MNHSVRLVVCSSFLWGCLGFAAMPQVAWSGDFEIKQASWNASKKRLEVKGKGDKRQTVTVTDAADLNRIIGTQRLSKENWRIRVSNPDQVPCRVHAAQGNGRSAEADVKGAPSDCTTAGAIDTTNPEATAAASLGDFKIDRATWSSRRQRLEVRGEGSKGETVTLTNAFDTELVLGSEQLDEDDWRIRVTRPDQVPCRVRVTQSNGLSDEATVRNAPNNCAPSGPVDPPTPVIADMTIGDVIFSESASASIFTVSLSVAAQEDVQVAFSTQDGSAIAGQTGDYLETSGTLTIPAGSTSGSIPIALVNDSAVEPTETFELILSNPTNANLADNVGVASILDDDEITPPAQDVSINSTSWSSNETLADPYVEGPVAEQPFVGNNTHRVFAINDLGMHCGDLDTRIASILPPFQVLLAQVIERGGEPKILEPGTANVTYSAVSNPDDPVLSDPNVFRGVRPDGQVYKTNFWDIASQAYAPFYPPGILDAFYDPLNPDNNKDLGLPVPNVEELYIGADGQLLSGDEHLVATQHAMPGMTAPYVSNVTHSAKEFYRNKPFFVNFPFGYVAEDLRWFEGSGIPMAAFDDFGRENPYPMVRVQATVGGNTVATTDTVLPISGEANCKSCHSADVEVSPETPNAGAALVNLADVATQIDDPAIGELPVNVSIEYASDINILRLHDQEHGTNLENETPVVCQRCHYTPALDLAHVGPVGPENDPDNANGRDQLKQSTMSNVMHGHHGATGLFPAIPAAQQAADGTILNQGERIAALDQNCYQCHPGKNSQCLRGAMFNGGMLCSDCHGDMAQVGNDFSKDVSPQNVGAFSLTGNFYDPQDPQARVPWANEPGCGSCHTGDANDSLVGTAGMQVNTADADGNPDGIRLRQAFVTGDSKATPIVPSNKRFAEPVVPPSFNGTANPGAGNPQLYRISTGHGGVMCEGCHGATHAEWPNANPNANDNVTAKQLQGHTGTISECETCHITSQLPDDTEGGPHGMHLVDDRRFWKEGHKDAAKRQNGRPGGGTCGSCHGSDHRGTVLSRTPIDRNWSVEGRNRHVAAGEPVGCDVCHSLSKSFGD